MSFRASRGGIERLGEREILYDKLWGTELFIRFLLTPSIAHPGSFEMTSWIVYPELTLS